MYCFHYMRTEGFNLFLFEDPEQFSSKDEEGLENSRGILYHTVQLGFAQFLEACFTG